jgi:hypothetical protein
MLSEACKVKKTYPLTMKATEMFQLLREKRLNSLRNKVVVGTEEAVAYLKQI